MSDMKEKILLTSLKLFASSGYEATSVSAISSQLGITKGALYKHYKNKQDILDSIIKRMEKDDFDRAQSYALPTGTLSDMPENYTNSSPDEIISFAKAQFRYWTGDSFASEFRKMLTVEQYRNKKMSGLFEQYLGNGPMGYVVDLFDGCGIKDSQTLALELYAPMYFLYSVYDFSDNKEYVNKLACEHFSHMKKILSDAMKTKTAEKNEI